MSLLETSSFILFFCSPPVPTEIYGPGSPKSLVIFGQGFPKSTNGTVPRYGGAEPRSSNRIPAFNSLLLGRQRETR